MPDFEFDCCKGVFGDLEKLKPTDDLEPLGAYVTPTQYEDASLAHDLAMGRSVTGILRLISNIFFGWNTKKQATVENAMFGSDFVAAWLCLEHAELSATLEFPSGRNATCLGIISLWATAP